MSPENKKFEILIETKVADNKTDTSVVTSPDTEDEIQTKDFDRENFRKQFLHIENCEINGEAVKPYMILEENPFYPVFKPEKSPDPFIAFEDYLRRCVGDSVY